MFSYWFGLKIFFKEINIVQVGKSLRAHNKTGDYYENI